LPVDTNDNIPNVEDEQKDPSSLLNRVKKLIELKHNEPALAGYADFIPLYAKENTYPFIYSRVNGKDAILVVLNPSEKSVSAEIQAPVPFKKLQLLAGKELKTSKTDKTLNLDIPGISFAIYKLK
jgi:maltose alpha-D-glucosyltransferase/alpha-amylase